MTDAHEALVAILREGRLLVVHRVPEDGDYWHLVGGGVEPGETAAAAAAREAFEEVGLAVQPADAGFAYDYDRDVRVHVDCFFVEVRPDWEPRLNWEHDGFRWVDAAEAAELLHWPEPRELAARLLR